MKINFVCPRCQGKKLEEKIIWHEKPLIVTAIDRVTRSLDYEALPKSLPNYVDHYQCADCHYVIPETNTQWCDDNRINLLYKWLEDNEMLLEEE